ncbi:MAG: hypothetical protein ABH886_05565 [Candidatus Desantisbacteria bacterium]
MFHSIIKMIKITYKLTLRPLYYQIYQQIYFYGKFRNVVLHIISLGIFIGVIYFQINCWMEKISWYKRVLFSGLVSGFVIILIFLQCGIIYFFIRKIKKSVIFNNILKPFSATFFPITITQGIAVIGTVTIAIIMLIGVIIFDNRNTAEVWASFELFSLPMFNPFFLFVLLVLCFPKLFLFWILFNQIMAGIAISKVLSISSVKVVLIMLFSFGICFCLFFGLIKWIYGQNMLMDLLFNKGTA